MAAVGRLRTAAEFQQVYRTGRTFHGPSFVVRVASGLDDTAGPRFGFVVSTKVAKSAVVRNRIRRRAREFVRRNCVGLTDATDVAVIAKAGAAKLSSSETIGELSSVFKQATLIR